MLGKQLRGLRNEECPSGRAEYDDAFVRGIMSIYNESPIRQGRRFWHYGKDFEMVKKENGTFLERSEYVGAFLGDELIGFIKMVYVDQMACTLQVISKQQHHDKKPTNALIAEAVQICENKAVTHLMYGSYNYDGRETSLTEFKRRNGFRPVVYPRYYVPLTAKGNLAMRLRLHHGVKKLIPRRLVERLRDVRSLFYRHRVSRSAR